MGLREYNMDRVCKNCKYWAQYELYHFGNCSNAKILTGYQYDLNSLPNDSALIEDDEGWAWYVGPEFGCVHFEAINK